MATMSNRIATMESANLASRVTAIESGLVQRLAELLANNEDKKMKLCFKDAKDWIPKEYQGERSKFRMWAQDVMVWATALYPDGARKLINDAVKCKDEFDEDDIDDITYPLGVEFSKVMYRTLNKYALGHARKYVVSAGHEKGLKAWQSMSKWYDSRETSDKQVAYATVMDQTTAKNEDELHSMFLEFEKKLREYEERFEVIPEEAKMNALKKIVPLAIMSNRFRGRKFDSHSKFRAE